MHLQDQNVKEFELSQRRADHFDACYLSTTECLVAEMALYALEHLADDLGREPPPLGMKRMLIKFLKWLPTLVAYAAGMRLRMKDANPRNMGYDPSRHRWAIIDAGCFQVAGGALQENDLWRQLLGMFDRFYTVPSSAHGKARFLHFIGEFVQRYQLTGDATVTEEELTVVAGGHEDPNNRVCYYNGGCIDMGGLKPQSQIVKMIRQWEGKKDARLAAAKRAGSCAPARVESRQYWRRLRPHDY